MTQQSYEEATRLRLLQAIADALGRIADALEEDNRLMKTVTGKGERGQDFIRVIDIGGD